MTSEEQVKEKYPDAECVETGFITNTYVIISKSFNSDNLSGFFPEEHLAWDNALANIKNEKG